MPGAERISVGGVLLTTIPTAMSTIARFVRQTGWQSRSRRMTPHAVYLDSSAARIVGVRFVPLPPRPDRRDAMRRGVKMNFYIGNARSRVPVWCGNDYARHFVGPCFRSYAMDQGGPCGPVVAASTVSASDARRLPWR